MEDTRTSGGTASSSNDLRPLVATLAPRAVAVIALDAASEAVVAQLARGSWNEAAFLTASSPRLMEEVERAELVVMIATPGSSIPAVPAIGAACSARRAMTTAIVTGAEAAPPAALSKTLAQLRPWSLMVVVANAEDYIEGVLTALRA